MADKKITDLQLRSDCDDDVNFPVDDGVQTYRNTAPQIRSYILNQLTDPKTLWNYSLAASVGSSALTITLKDAAGNNPAASSPVKMYFRSSTLTDGKPVLISLAAALSTVISSGSTAGHSDGKDEYLYIYAMNNAGAIELAWSSNNSWDEGQLWDTTAEGGAGGADAENVLYSTTARTGKAIRLIGRLKSNQSTAGTWATVPSEIALPPFFVESPDICIVSEHQSSGTGGGTASSGINTRVLNTVDNPKPWLSLASNQITLQPGKYFISASAPMLHEGIHKLLFTNTTDSVYAIIGDGNSQGSTVSEQKAMLKGTVKISAAKVFQLDHYATAGGDALGTAVGISMVDEVYSIVEIIKLY